MTDCARIASKVAIKTEQTDTIIKTTNAGQRKRIVNCNLTAHSIDSWVYRARRPEPTSLGETICGPSLGVPYWYRSNALIDLA